MEEEMSNPSDASKLKSLRQINPTLLRSLSLKDENNLDDFIVVFIDISMETSDDNQLLLSDLQSIINGTVHSFNSLDSSLKFIQENETLKIFLILSGSFGQMHGHHFFQLPQIICIYIFCHDPVKHQNWTNAVKTMRGVFDDKDPLLKTLCHDVKTFASRWSFVDESSFQKASTNDGRWYQLFIRILIHQPRTENTKKDMLKECRSFYKSNPTMVGKINHFEKHYTPDQAIEYYCQDSFVYRIVNYALRTHNINIIIKFQPYISDLYTLLEKKYRHQSIDFKKGRTESPDRIAYRGQYMQETELEQLKDYCRSRNSSVMLNMFGSATRNPEIAFQFIPDDRPGYIRCLYQIIIPDHYYIAVNISSILCHQFVDIADQGTNEQEVIFSVGSVFRIRYIGRPTSDRSWVPIVLEFYIDEQDFCWEKLGRRIKDESDEMKRELIEFVKQYTTKGNKLNWVQWWQRLERRYEIEKDCDESLLMIMYEGFDHSESITKAIELRKRSLIINNQSLFQSGKNDLAFFLREMKFGKPTRIIALYELFQQSCNGHISSQQYDCADVAQVFQYAGKAYVNYPFYKENALHCYHKALELLKHNSNDQTIDHLRCKITELTSQISGRKFDYHRDVSETGQMKITSVSEYQTQLVTMTDYEIEYDQWYRFRQFHKEVRNADLRSKAHHRLSYLSMYLRDRERWIDNCELRILLNMPLQKEQTIDSTTDIFPSLLLAVRSHLRTKKNLGTDRINLWRYEKFMLEWLSLNDIKRTLTFYRYTEPKHFQPILLILNRLIEKLKLIVVWCTLMITVSSKQGIDDFIVNVNKLNFVKVGITNVPKLVFFDDRDEITKDTVRAELETFAH